VHPLLRIPYAVAGATAQLAAALAPRSSGKLGASLRARREIRARYTDWGAAHRDPARPLLWIHAPSVGEGLQARPVIALLRARHPQLQIAYTFFSPSAAPFAEGIGADFCDYLPFDTFGDSDAAVRALRPTALVFSKLDVWPTLVERAVAHGVRVGLISATLAEESGRTSTFASWLLRDAYEALDAVGAIDTRDATRLIQLGARADRVHVTGDTRYDQVRERATAADRSGSLLAPLAGTRPTLVAGSTWPSDEAPLLKAWRDVRGRLPQARMIIAPHEPTDVKLAIIERWAEQSQLQLARIGSASQAMADVVLVDRVGVLGDLYALADVAFVGGGFHRAGLHSVLEPAAFGVPVLFGKRNRAPRRGGGRPRWWSLDWAPP
jgi:3-deoxy-D-manno-octulosonic-acid transferase